jgi:hypothetical protein
MSDRLALPRGLAYEHVETGLIGGNAIGARQA